VLHDAAHALAAAADEARRAAAAAADRAAVEVRDVHDLDHLRAMSGLFDAVWGRDRADAGPAMTPELLRAMAHTGCQVSAAFDRDGRMVGATAAILGMQDDQVFVHSHITGTLADVRGHGVGWTLKQHQRAWCLTRGITTVRWTYDPLIRRNAVFNVVKLGARPVEYLEDAYGPMHDAVNAGLPTDRVVTDWDLTAARVVQAAGGRFAEPQLEALRRGGATEVLRDDAGEPVTAPVAGARLLAQVPADVEAMRAADVARAQRWTDAARATLAAALGAGYQVTGITRDGWYVLVRSGDVEELV
jgi:predicted GNAT superfamily acetyltransferase